MIFNSIVGLGRTPFVLAWLIGAKFVELRSAKSHTILEAEFVDIWCANEVLCIGNLSHRVEVCPPPPFLPFHCHPWPVPLTWTGLRGVYSLETWNETSFQCIIKWPFQYKTCLIVREKDDILWCLYGLGLNWPLVCVNGKSMIWSSLTDNEFTLGW